MVSILVVGLLLVSGMAMMGGAVRARRSQGLRREAPALARHLLTEILSQAYEEPDDPPAFGPESGESGGDRTDWDDVDDYDGWNQQPPMAKDGTPLAGYDGWRREVFVARVVPATLANVATETGVKKITVHVVGPGDEDTTITALRSKLGAVDQDPLVETTYVSWVGVELQMGEMSTPLVLGANLLNVVAP